MSDVQWAFEYHALRLQEEARLDLVAETIKQLRRQAIDMLGLNVAGRIAGIEPTSENDPGFVLPLTLYASNPDMLNHLVKVAQDTGAEEAAADDSDFDALSAQLMQSTLPTEASGDDGDMLPLAEPLDLSPEARRNPYLHSEAYKAAAKGLIRPRNSPDPEARPRRVVFED